MKKPDHESFSVRVLTDSQKSLFDHFFTPKTFGLVKQDLSSLSRYNLHGASLDSELFQLYNGIERRVYDLMFALNPDRPLRTALDEVRFGELAYVEGRAKNLLTAELALSFLRDDEYLEPGENFTRREIKEKLKQQYPDPQGEVRVGLTNFAIKGNQRDDFTIPLAVSFESVDSGWKAFFWDGAITLPTTERGLERMFYSINRSRSNPGREKLQEALHELASDEGRDFSKPINEISTSTPIDLVYLSAHEQRKLPGFNSTTRVGLVNFDEVTAVSFGILAGRFEDPTKWRDHLEAVDRLAGKAA